MGRGILAAELRRFEETGKRREGFNVTYTFADAIKSAFGLFFFQHRSMLSYQDSLDRGNQRKNAENILNVKEIPCNNQITRLIDGIEPGAFDGNFKDGLSLAEEYSGLDQYKVLDGGVLLALDGVWYHASEKVHCEHCLHLTKNGRTTYYHSMTAAVMVRPGGDVVVPLAPEMIRNEDAGEERDEGNYEKHKQDGERKAAARLLEKHGKYYKALGGDLKSMIDRGRGNDQEDKR